MGEPAAEKCRAARKTAFLYEIGGSGLYFVAIFGVVVNDPAVLTFLISGIAAFLLFRGERRRGWAAGYKEGADA